MGSTKVERIDVGGGMKIAGNGSVFLGVFVQVIGWMLNTAVPSSAFAAANPEFDGVINLQLLQRQELVILTGLMLTLIGVVLLATASVMWTIANFSSANVE